MNISNKNNFCNKLTITSVNLLISLIYVSSIILIPVINNKKNNNYINSNYNLNKNNKIFSNIVITKFNIAIFDKINKVTYINNGKILDRQIDNNNNLQEFINDAKGSILKLNNLNDTVNNKTYFYDAYGNVISNPLKSSSISFPRKLDSSSLTIPNSFQYNGERFDTNSKLQYLRARFYSPENKRFLTQDNFNLINRFIYVNSNPVIATDSTGHVIEINYESFGLRKPSNTTELLIQEKFIREINQKFNSCSDKVIKKDPSKYDLNFSLHMEYIHNVFETHASQETYFLFCNDIRKIRTQYLWAHKEYSAKTISLKLTQEDQEMYSVLCNTERKEILDTAINYLDGFIASMLAHCNQLYLEHTYLTFLNLNPLNDLEPPLKKTHNVSQYDATDLEIQSYLT